LLFCPKKELIALLSAFLIREPEKESGRSFLVETHMQDRTTVI